MDSDYGSGFKKEIRVTLEIIEEDGLEGDFRVSLGEDFNKFLWESEWEGTYSEGVVVGKGTFIDFIESQEPQYKLNMINKQMAELEKQREEISKYV